MRKKSSFKEWKSMKLRERAERLKIDLPAVFIALRKKETPIIAKILAGIIIAYALSPIDLVPDFIPVLGYIDDVIILPGLVALTVRMIPPNTFAECRIQAEGLWANCRPKKWYFALPIVVVWLLLVYLIIYILV